MYRNSKLHKDFVSEISFFDAIIEDFESKGEEYGNQKRNSLKLFEFQHQLINVKSFKIPNFFNKIIYRFFRKSKAQRSFEYANKLISLEIGTPKPIGYYEFFSALFFNKSYYLSEQLDYDLTYRELIHQPDYPDYENILRAFTRFTYDFHQKGIYFLDHSPGNTLIKKVEEGYLFSLVDLNRMRFKNLSFDERIKNFERLTTQESMIKIMSDEYAKCSNQKFDTIFEMMQTSAQEFHRKFHRKKEIKRQLKFWK